MASPVFTSSRNSFLVWQTLGILVLLLLFLSSSLIAEISYIFYVFTLSTVAIVIYRYFNTNYTIRNHQIVCWMGLHKNHIEINNIKTIRKVAGDISYNVTDRIYGNGKAGILLWMKDNQQIYISPEPRAAFIAELRKQQPDIVVETDLVVA